MELSDRIREIALEKYIKPAKAAGRTHVSIAIKTLKADTEAEGISTIQRVPMLCTSIRKRDFLRDNELVIERVEGPKSGLSTTVVVHYRIDYADVQTKIAAKSVETSEERVDRLLESLRGLMKDEIAVRGGVEGYMRWVRGYDEDES